MAVLKKSDLRKRDTGTRYLEVPLPNGDSVLLRSFSRANHREWRKSLQRKDGSEDPVKSQYSNDVLAAMSIVDPDTKETVFSVADALAGIFDSWDDADFTTVVVAATKHCGLLGSMGDTEGAVKNSNETPGSDSSGVSAGEQG